VTKLQLRVPTLGKKRGDVIDVPAEDVDRLVKNGTVRRVKSPAAPVSQSDKG
jgi:hypothetical protein